MNDLNEKILICKVLKKSFKSINAKYKFRVEKFGLHWIVRVQVIRESLGSLLFSDFDFHRFGDFKYQIGFFDYKCVGWRIQFDDGVYLCFTVKKLSK